MGLAARQSAVGLFAGGDPCTASPSCVSFPRSYLAGPPPTPTLSIPLNTYTDILYNDASSTGASRPSNTPSRAELRGVDRNTHLPCCGAKSVGVGSRGRTPHIIMLRVARGPRCTCS